ncbi:MAG: monovalent cation/H(+) antiporter subunit G [Methanomicrobiales archaeon]
MIAEWIILVCLVIGVIFNALGVIGILRFPDVYTRLHAETKTTTFGSIFLCIAVIIYALFRAGDLQFSVHVLVALVALAFTNATGAHAIARAAHRSGQMPVEAVTDRLAEGER